MRRLFLSVFVFASVASAQNVNFVMLYHSAWGDGRMIDSTFFNRNSDLVTHIIHFKVDPIRTPPYISFDGGEGNHAKNRVQMIAEAHAKGVKVLLCIGGVGQGAQEWYNITADSSLTQTVVNAMSTYALTWGYDGLDLDWESDMTRDRFMLLSRILRRKLDSWPTRGTLTAAIGREWNVSQDVPTLNTLYDYVNIMAYDGNAYWSCTSGFHEPLFDPRPNWPGYCWDGGTVNIDRASNTWVSRGLNKAKASLGLALYGWSWVQVTGPGQNFSPVSNGVGYATYMDVMGMISEGAVRHYDSLAAQPWISRPGGPRQYANYQDAQSINQKMDYLKAQHWGGVMLFANEHAADLSKPLDSRWPLLQAVRNNINPPAAAAPSFSLQPASIAVTAGSTAAFSVSVAGFPIPSLQWQKNGENIPGATAPMYVTPVLSVADNGATFRCVATNPQGIASSNGAVLTVNAPVLSAPIFLSQPSNASVTVGTQATFTATLSGLPIPTIQWQQNGVSITGATNTAYTTPPTTPNDDGATYRCIATNSLGTAQSNSAMLTVTSPTIANPTSDDFSSVSRSSSIWRMSNPAATSYVGQNTSDALLRLNLDATPHDLWTNDFGAVRVMQDITNGNFEVVAKFQSLPTATYQMEGLVVKENANSWLRFDFLKDNTGLKFFSASVTSTGSTVRINNVISVAGGAAWIKLNRTGDTWTASFSSDNATYTQAGQFVQGFVVDSIGVFAGNQSNGTATIPFECRVDYFFNVSNPINPEDPVLGAPTGSFNVDNDTLAVGGGTVTLNWNSSSAVSASIDQGIGNVSVSGSRSVSVTETKTFTLTLTNAVGSQTYQVRIFVPLPGAVTGAFSASVDTLPVGGGNTTLMWSSANAVSASIDQGIGSVPVSGSRTISVAATKTFTLTLSNSVSSQTYQVRVFVPIPGAVTGSLSASVDTLPIGGGEVTLTWLSSNAVTASINQGIGTVPLTGSRTIIVGKTTTYTLILSNSVNTDSFKTTVAVRLPSGGGNPNDLTSVGSPLVLVANPTGVGNKNIEIIRDGIAPIAGSTNPNDQYDTYNGGGPRATDWVGYNYPTSQTFGSIVFQEGIHAQNGGYFAGTPAVEVFVDERWIPAQGMTVEPAYGSGSAANFSTYTFRFYAVSANGIRIIGTPGGQAKYISVAEFRVLNGTTGNERPAAEAQPKDYFLLPNYPNPFNPTTTIEFRLPGVSSVKLEVYNMLGQKIRTLVDGTLGQGTWSQVWDGQDEFGYHVSSGVYIYKLQSGSFVETRKMILSK